MAKTWLTKDNENFFASDFDVVESLRPGYYECAWTRDGLRFSIIPVKEDRIYDVSDDAARLFREVERFWGAKEKYAAMGVSLKRGILLHGPAGGGKSTVVRQAINRVVGMGGFAVRFSVDDDITQFVQALREREQKAPIVAVFEDIDSWVDEEEEGLLEFLDGSSQVENILFIGTTNNYEDLPDRIKDRPGRFDTQLEIGMPSDEAKRKFIGALLGLPDAHEKVIAYSVSDAIKDRSLAHVKEFVLMKEIYDPE